MLRRFLVLFVPALAFLGAIVAVLYVQDLAASRLVHGQEAAHMARLEAEIIAAEFRAIRSDLLYLAEQAGLRDFLAEASSPERKSALAEEFRLFCERKGTYDQIRLLDETGWERVRVNDRGGSPRIVPEEELQPKAQRYYFEKTFPLGRGDVYVSPFDLNVEHDRVEEPRKPVIRFATPAFDRSGKKRGIVVLNYLGSRLLGKQAEVSRGFRGEAMLLNGEGFWLRGPSPEVEWAFLYGRDASFARERPDAWRAIAAAERGHLLAAEGLYAFETAGAGDGGLKVVAFVPLDGLVAGSRALLRRLLVVSAFAAAALALLSFFLARARTAREAALGRLRESEARLRTLTQQLLTAEEEERKRVSRDLHDDLGQLATSLCLDLERLAAAAPSWPEEGSKREALLGRALSGARSVLDRVREIAARLRPCVLDDLGLEVAVRSDLAEFEDRTGIAVTADLRLDGRSLPPAASGSLYRILKEALTNAAKHARTAHVYVALRDEEGRVGLSIRDEGVGFEGVAPPNGSSLGLLGIRERAELLGGTCEVDTAPGHGTDVRVSIPLEAEAQRQA